MPLNYNDLIAAEVAGETHWPIVVGGKYIRLRLSELLDGVEPKPQRQARAKKLSQVSIVGHGHIVINKGDGDVSIDDHSINARDITNSQVGTLTNCTNMIQQQAAGEKKSLLEQLDREVPKLIEALPDEKKEEAVQNYKLLIEQATAEKPNRKWYSVSAEGLIEASKSVNEFTGNIAGTIGNLGKLLWPNFQLAKGE